MGTLLLLAIALFAMCMVALAAEHRGRGVIRWGLFAFVCWPLALVVLLVAGPTEAERTRRVEADERARIRAREAV
jgi:hypothetical protein